MKKKLIVFLILLFKPQIIILPLCSFICLYLPNSKPIPLESIKETLDKSNTVRSALFLAIISVIAFFMVILAVVLFVLIDFDTAFTVFHYLIFNSADAELAIVEFKSLIDILLSNFFHLGVYNTLFFYLFVKFDKQRKK